MCSSDLYVVSHDGFTLRDLVTYTQRRNEANGEGNRDGHAHEHGANFGVEGETDRPEVEASRARAVRALLATLCLAQGTPMLAAGSELGHTQHGNNNPYCQDNETTWIDWSRADAALAAFVAYALRIRRERLPFGNFWFEGKADGRGTADIAWLAADGGPLEGDAWQSTDRALGVLIGRPGRATGEALLLWINGADAPREAR